MTGVVDAFDSIVAQKSIDDYDIRGFHVDGLDTCRLEYEARGRSKIAFLEGLDEASNILARVGDVADSVEGVRRRLQWRFVRSFRRPVAQELPLCRRELTGERGAGEL
jgi:hypothetical protein